MPRLQPPDQLTTILLWVTAIFIALKEGIENWPAALKTLPWVHDWGWLSFVPLGLLGLAATVMMYRAWRPAPPKEMIDPDWESKLELITGQEFINCTVQVDGKKYIACKFNAVTFVYNGGPMAFQNNTVGPHLIKTDREDIKRYLHLLVNFGHIASKIYEDAGEVSLADLDVRNRNRRAETQSPEKA